MMVFISNMLDTDLVAKMEWIDVYVRLISCISSQRTLAVSTSSILAIPLIRPPFRSLRPLLYHPLTTDPTPNRLFNLAQRWILRQRPARFLGRSHLVDGSGFVGLACLLPRLGRGQVADCFLRGGWRVRMAPVA